MADASRSQPIPFGPRSSEPSGPPRHAQAHPRDVVQPDLFYADGETFDPAQDGARLRAQLDAVRTLMADGQWRTLADIARCVQAPEASVSARLRDLRKPRFGMYVVVRQRVPNGHGLHRYRVVPLE